MNKPSDVRKIERRIWKRRQKQIVVNTERRIGQERRFQLERRKNKLRTPAEKERR